MATQTSIAIKRRPDMFGVARKLRVLVDGEEIGRVGAGERTVFAVPAGTHEVTVAMDWCRSEPMEVSAEEGQPVELIARVRHGSNMLMNLVALIGWPRQFFIVQPAYGANSQAA